MTTDRAVTINGTEHTVPLAVYELLVSYRKRQPFIEQIGALEALSDVRMKVCRMTGTGLGGQSVDSLIKDINAALDAIARTKNDLRLALLLERKLKRERRQLFRAAALSSGPPKLVAEVRETPDDEEADAIAWERANKLLPVKTGRG